MGRPIPIEDVVEPHPHNRRRPPIAKTHPHLSAEWIYEKNCGFGPEDFTYGSDVAPWWRCLSNKKHIWQAPIQLRAARGNNCPYCSSRRLSKEKSLAVLYPKIAAEWHPTRNKTLTPFDVMAHANEPVWFLCKTCGNEWRTAVGNRTNRGKHGCCKCAKNILDIMVGEYSYAMKYFHRTKNKGIDPSWLPIKQKVHWQCPKANDHIWYQSFTKRCQSESTFCPFCNNKKTSRTNSLATLAPNLAKEWHPTRNGKLTPNMVTASSGVSRAWWLCSTCKHSWQTLVGERYRNRNNCPKCQEKNKARIWAEVGLRNRIGQEYVEQIKELFAKKISQQEISRRLGIGDNTVHRVLKR